MLDFFHVVLCIVLLVSSTLWGMWIILGSKQCDEPFPGFFAKSLKLRPVAPVFVHLSIFLTIDVIILQFPSLRILLLLLLLFFLKLFFDGLTD